MDEIGLVRLGAESLDTEHICCAIGDDKENRARAATKKAWLAERLRDGHTFLKADIRGKAFIEYGSAEKAWFPIEAPHWLFALFAKASKKGGDPPRFADGAREGRLARASKGLDLFWSPLCPFVPSVAAEMAGAARSAGITARLHEIDSVETARALRAPPGIFQAYLDGSFLTHELMTPDKFLKLIAAAKEARA